MAVPVSVSASVCVPAQAAVVHHAKNLCLLQMFLGLFGRQCMSCQCLSRCEDILSVYDRREPVLRT